MNITKYKGHTEIEIYELINRVKENDNEALEQLLLIFENKLYIKNNPNYNNELTSFFCELLLKVPLNDVLEKHKLINYILSSLKKKKSKIYENQSNSPIKLKDYNSIIANSTSNFTYDLIDELVTLKSSLSNLSIDEKNLLILYYQYGYSEEEIGNYFNGISKAAICKRKKKIIKKLKENF